MILTSKDVNKIQKRRIDRFWELADNMGRLDLSPEIRNGPFDDILGAWNNQPAFVVGSSIAARGFDLKKLGNLMNENHELLKKINVSCEKLDEMVDIAKDAGAFGAKLTGTGRGGLMLALTPGIDLQEKVAKVFKDKNYFVIKTSIG